MHRFIPFLIGLAGLAAVHAAPMHGAASTSRANTIQVPRIVPSSLASTAWHRSTDPTFAAQTVALYTPIGGTITEIRMSVTDAAATASSVTTLSVPHGAGAPTVHVPDGAPIAASQGFEFGGRTVSVFVAGNMVGGQTTSTLYVYESVPGVAGRASSTATTGWTVRTVVPTLSQNIVSISSVVYSGSSRSGPTFALVYQTADWQLWYTSRDPATGKWSTSAAVTLPGVSKKHALALLADSSDAAATTPVLNLWLDTVNRYTFDEQKNTWTPVDTGLLPSSQPTTGFAGATTPNVSGGTEQHLYIASADGSFHGITLKGGHSRVVMDVGRIDVVAQGANTPTTASSLQVGNVLGYIYVVHPSGSKGGVLAYSRYSPASKTWSFDNVIA